MPLIDPNARPLSAAALDALADSSRAPVPAQSVNPGIVRKLTDEGWCSLVDIPSPYKSARPGARVQALEATEQGRARLAYEAAN